MINRGEIIVDVLDSLFNTLLQSAEEIGLDLDDHDTTKAYMMMFIWDKAKDLSDEELLTAFGDQIQVLKEYIEYIRGILERSGKRVH